MYALIGEMILSVRNESPSVRNLEHTVKGRFPFHANESGILRPVQRNQQIHHPPFCPFAKPLLLSFFKSMIAMFKDFTNPNFNLISVARKYNFFISVQAWP